MAEFIVRTAFGGTVEWKGEAETEEDACDKANDAIGDMDDDEFVPKMEPQRLNQDVELVTEESKLRWE